MIKIAPSILAADPLNLERDVRRAEEAGCDWLHIDVMDAHFVPNLAYSPKVVRRLKEATSLPLDVHLMMDHPETLAECFLDAGADILTIHAEADTDPLKLTEMIHRAGAKAGIALKPGTPAEAVLPLLGQAELILAMTVEPGFGGQKLDESVVDKIRQLRDTGWQGWIEADGGIKEDNIARLFDAGLDVAVMGTALFREKDMRPAVERMHQMIRKSEA
ncbi:MAG: ribulose-phosphate 3-epimerase [Clostridia bacterium]|nr:ribulose-phosphate 3-epimerase [Clostridia bacterium]